MFPKEVKIEVGLIKYFHGLIFIPKFKDDDTLFPAVIEPKLYKVVFDEWRRNYGSRRNPIWKPLFTYAQKWRHGKLYRNFDLHYVVPHSTEHGSDDVAFYCSKYLLKPCGKEVKLQQALKLNLDPLDYEDVWKIVRSRSFASLGFGGYTDKEIAYITACIDKSADDIDGLKYFASDGSTQPLATYYRKFLDGPHAIRTFKARPDFPDNRPVSELVRIIDNGDRVTFEVAQKDVSPFYPD